MNLFLLQYSFKDFKSAECEIIPMKILGIDEAGRGPVIGSLFMCGYLIEEKKVPELRKIGVKDSKLLSRSRREQIFEKIKTLSDDFVILKTSAKEIDQLRTVRSEERR